ncbi:uncharacterized protein UV8b_05362 [Ustilaginoidea virens]|uniref:Uncharacterized protein n=1 Tax=Ustilaginoidea virens TaxID=1159556 RepID=A0A8E5HTU9_USTVR|nr:uncharacterized protein UV8b_05362 [Ustilaginoidea virens]QUC21119.1 hypothetical protein UV8b_05362 [Ustilaginoidea virens]
MLCCELMDAGRNPPSSTHQPTWRCIGCRPSRLSLETDRPDPKSGRLSLTAVGAVLARFCLPGVRPSTLPPSDESVDVVTLPLE